MAADQGITYEIIYTKIADRFFKKHASVKKEYENAIRELLVGDHPETINVKKIKGKRNDYYRISLSNWRVIYAIINGKIVVINTLLAGARGDIYKKMDGLK